MDPVHAIYLIIFIDVIIGAILAFYGSFSPTLKED